MENNLFSTIVEYSIKAAISNEIAHNYDKSFYSNKERYYNKAIALLKSNKIKNIWFKVSPKNLDQNGYMSVIYYINIKVNGNIYQLSFHKPYRKYMANMKEQGHKEIVWSCIKNEKILKSLAKALKINLFKIKKQILAEWGVSYSQYKSMIFPR